VIDLHCGTEIGMFNSNVDGRPLQDKSSFIALFDGHSGPHCSEFLADFLKDQIFKSPNYPSNLPKAIHEAYLTTDNDFLQKAKYRNLDDGSTAMTLFISKNTIYAASVGDSGGYIYSKEGIIPLIDSDTAIGRGMGSIFYKDTTSELLAEPIIKQHVVTPNLEFVILGTWTFWQSVPHQEAIQYVIQKITEKNTPENSSQSFEAYLSNICLDMVSRAGQKNMGVNISCLVVVFDHKDSGGLFDIEV